VRCATAKLKQITPCERCKRHVPQDSDFRRAHFVGRTAYWHFSCWMRELREHEAAREERKSA